MGEKGEGSLFGGRRGKGAGVLLGGRANLMCCFLSPEARRGCQAATPGIWDPVCRPYLWGSEGSTLDKSRVFVFYRFSVFLTFFCLFFKFFCVLLDPIPDPRLTDGDACLGPTWV